jgi:hypothetical protein
VVKTTGTDAWVGQDNSITWYDGSVWQFDVPAQGWTVYNKADSAAYVYSGSAWVKSDIATKMALVPSATANNLASFDGSGQVKDSGVSAPTYDAALGALIITV